jgi:hypothetical protein
MVNTLGTCCYKTKLDSVYTGKTVCVCVVRCSLYAPCLMVAGVCCMLVLNLTIFWILTILSEYKPIFYYAGST